MELEDEGTEVPPPKKMIPALKKSHGEDSE